MVAALPIETTQDAFLGGALHLLQPRFGYRAGMDAVLLAAAAPAEADPVARIADLGSGVGTVGLCIARRVPGTQVDLVEREPELAELAAVNAARNELADRVHVIPSDLTSGDAIAALPSDHYDLVVANPPFYAASKTRLSSTPMKAAAHAFNERDFELWAKCMARITRPSGTLALIHTAEALDIWLAVLSRRFGALSVVPIYARDDGEAATRCLLYGTKGSRRPLQIGPGLVLHDHTNAFRPEVACVLRAPLALGHWPWTPT